MAFLLLKLKQLFAVSTSTAPPDTVLTRVRLSWLASFHAQTRAAVSLADHHLLKNANLC